MSTQLDWIAGKIPFQPRSDTSKAAATAILPKAPTLRAKVLAFIRHYGTYGCTDQEICDALRLDPSTARPRRVELVRDGQVIAAGKRKTRAGREATVWIGV